MKIQILLRDGSDIDEKLEFLKDWEELSYRLDSQPYGGCQLFVLEIPDEDFDKTLGIFQSREEAMGAFLSVAMEKGWEVVPDSYVIYHAQFEGDKLIAGIKAQDGVERFEQITLENMIRKMAMYPRVVVLSYDVVTYIKDIYPEIDLKLYVLSRELSRLGREMPHVEGKSLEEVLLTMEEYLRDPSLPPVSKPVSEC